MGPPGVVAPPSGSLTCRFPRDLSLPSLLARPPPAPEAPGLVLMRRASGDGPGSLKRSLREQRTRVNPMWQRVTRRRHCDALRVSRSIRRTLRDRSRQPTPDAVKRRVGGMRADRTFRHGMAPVQCGPGSWGAQLAKQSACHPFPRMNGFPHTPTVCQIVPAGTMAVTPATTAMAMAMATATATADRRRAAQASGSSTSAAMGGSVSEIE